MYLKRYIHSVATLTKAFVVSCLSCVVLTLPSCVRPQAMIIAFSSDMIPRLVYYWSFSVFPYGDHAQNTMSGYINNTLSIFNIDDFSNSSRPRNTPFWFKNISTCRYSYTDSTDDLFKIKVHFVVCFKTCFENGSKLVISTWLIKDNLNECAPVETAVICVFPVGFVWVETYRCLSLPFSYRDFRNPPGHPREYQYNMQYWHVVAAKMAFIIVVEVSTSF